METDDLISEISIESHSRSENGQQKRKARDRGDPYAKATGKLVKNPKRKDPTPATAAVAVMRSRLIPDSLVWILNDNMDAYQ
jgi:hypothetical protein